MAVEKATVKGNGFLDMFNWSGDSRAKLSNNFDFERHVNANKVDRSPSTRSNNVDDADTVGSSSMKKASEYSYSSTEDGVYEKRSPGVVARLMGLDALPVALPPTTDLSPSQSVDSQHDIGHHRNAHFLGKAHPNLAKKFGDGYPWKMAESGPHTNAIDKFKMEQSPQRYSKISIVLHRNQPSPISNSNSERNAADLIKAASGIMGPPFTAISKYKDGEKIYVSPSPVYNSIGQTKNLPWQSAEQVPVQSETLVPEGHKSGKSSRRRPKGPPSRPLVGDNNAVDQSHLMVKSKITPTATRGSSIPHAAKSTTKYTKRDRNLDEKYAVQPPKSRLGNQSFQNQRNLKANASNMLAPNNRKQNLTVNKNKVNSNAVVNQQQERVHAKNDTQRKIRNGNIHAVGNNVHKRMEEVRVTNEIAGKRNSKVGSSSQTIYEADSPEPIQLDKPVNKMSTNIQHNIVIDQQSALPKSKDQSSSEILSFTFTTPMDKSVSRSFFNDGLIDTRHLEHEYSRSSSISSSNAEAYVEDDDNLAFKIVRKLRTLASGVRSPYSKPIIGSPPTFLGLGDTTSAFETSSYASAENDTESMKSCREGFGQSDSASDIDKFTEDMEFRSISGKTQQSFLDLSPSTSWEASQFTGDTYSAESWKTFIEQGDKLLPSGEGMIPLHVTYPNNASEIDADAEFSDTASSLTVATADAPMSELSTSYTLDHPVDFVREILNLCSRGGDLYSAYQEHLGNWERPKFAFNGYDDRILLQMLSDCVIEFLSSNCEYYFSSGYHFWSKGVVFLSSLSVDDVYRDMAGIQIANDSMVDRLVEQEMNSPQGNWIDLENQSHEVADVIETALMSILIEELITDIME